MGVKVLFAFAKVEDGVADELAGTVISGLSATTDFENRVGEALTGAQGGLIAQPPDRVDRRMFQQEQGFDSSSVEQFMDGGFLDAQSFRVVHVRAQVDHLHAGKGTVRGASSQSQCRATL